MEQHQLKKHAQMKSDGSSGSNSNSINDRRTKAKKPRRYAAACAAGTATKMTETNSSNKKIDIQLSKSLSWVLRHSAPSLGLKLAPDGFVPVEHVLALNHPRFCIKGNGTVRPKYTVEDVKRVVRDNDKQRFRLEYRDSDENPDGSDHSNSNSKTEDQTMRKENTNTPCLNQSNNSICNEIEEGTNNNKVLCIRANQGHSLKGLEADQLLTPLTKEELSDPNLTIIHGTTQKAWEDHIQQEGLSRMKRNHIHFATGLPPSKPNAATKKQTDDKKESGIVPISGMRSSSEIYIYVNGATCAEDGINFYRSDNGVILTAGFEENGMLPVKYFEKVVHASSGGILWKHEDASS